MTDTHLTSEGIQEWLDGRLSPAEAGRIQAHLDGCARCRSEADAWGAMLHELAALPSLEPGDGFRGRVLDAVGRDQPETASLPWAARARAVLGGLLGRPSEGKHPDGALLQELVEGRLGRRRAGAVRAHVAACGSCGSEFAAWADLLERLDALPRLAPAPGLEAAVMARVRVPAVAPRTASRRDRILNGARALAHHRRAWAALAGVALTPAVVAGVVAYAVFSHPLVTIGNLATFAVLKGGAALGTLSSGLVESLVESAALFRAWAALDTLARSPGTAGAGLLVFCSLTLAAVWVLYRNLFAAPMAQPAHAKLS